MAAMVGITGRRRGSVLSLQASRSGSWAQHLASLSLRVLGYKAFPKTRVRVYQGQHLVQQSHSGTREQRQNGARDDTSCSTAIVPKSPAACLGGTRGQRGMGRPLERAR